MVKTCGVCGLMNAESHTNLYVVSPCSFLQRLVEKKKRRRQRRRNQFFCRVKQLFTDISTNGDERCQAKEKQEENEKKNTLTVDEEERERKKPLSFFKYMQVMAMQRRAESKCGGRRGEGSDTNLCECELHRVGWKYRIFVLDVQR